MDKRKRQNIIWIERGLIDSEAFCSLRTTASYVVLMVFLSKRQMVKQRTAKRQQWTIANNGEIVFTYKEAEQEYGISPARFTKALDELIDKGFIDIAGQGMGVHKVETHFSISKRWRKYGTPDFVKKSRPKGPINRGFQKGNRYGRNCRKEEKD